jgi:hypothetical protein
METHEDLGAVLGMVEFNSEALISRALLDGRRLQRRRRVGAGVGILAVGALALGASLHFGGSGQADSIAVAGQGTTDQGPGMPSPEITDARLTVRLPVSGDPVSATSGGVKAQPFVRVLRTLDPDGSGAGTVLVELVGGRPLSQTRITQATQGCSQMSGKPGSSESFTPVAHGCMFTSASHPDSTDASSRAFEHIASVTFEDGTSVYVRASNYVHVSDPTRDAPVLSMAEVEQLAMDPVWFQPGS